MRRTKRITENDEYAAMLVRLIAALGERMADDPTALVYADVLTEQLREAKLTAIARAARAADEGGTYTLGELVAILGSARPGGITRQAVHQLIGKGRALIARNRARLGVVSLRAYRKQRLAGAGVPERKVAAR